MLGRKCEFAFFRAALRALEDRKEMQHVILFPLISNIIWQFKYLWAVKFNDMKQLKPVTYVRPVVAFYVREWEWQGFSEE